MAIILFKVVRICNSQFKCNYRRIDTHFLNFLLHSLNLHQILNILKKEMIVIANVFPKLQTVNILVRPLSKKRRFSRCLAIENVKASLKTCEISMRALVSCFSSFPGKLICKMSPLVWGEILGVSVNTSTADGQYPVQGCENLQIPIQKQLSEKPKSFSEFFLSFLYSAANFEHFEKEYDGPS